MPRSSSQAPAEPNAGISVMVSEYQLHWKAIWWKAKLETRLECRQYWLAEQPAVQHLFLRAGTAMSAETESQPQTWQLWNCHQNWHRWDLVGQSRSEHLQMVTQEPPGCRYCPSSAPFQTEKAPAAWLEETTLQATLSYGKWLRPLLHTHFHTWLKTKEISLNLQAVLHRDKREEKNTHAFLFCPFQARANKSGQDGSFITELNLKNVPTLAWTKTIWVLSNTWKVTEFACREPNSSQLASLLPCLTTKASLLVWASSTHQSLIF